MAKEYNAVAKAGEQRLKALYAEVNQLCTIIHELKIVLKEYGNPCESCANEVLDDYCEACLNCGSGDDSNWKHK